MTTKPFWESMTFWLNIAGLITLVLQYMLNTALIPLQYQEAALAILNIVNRFNTVGKVTLTK